MKVAIRVSPARSSVAAATDAPCIARVAVAPENPVPTTVTVVPAEAVDGLTTVKVGASTVYGTELNPAVLDLI